MNSVLGNNLGDFLQWVKDFFQKPLDFDRILLAGSGSCGLGWVMRWVLAIFMGVILEVRGWDAKLVVDSVMYPSLSEDGGLVVFEWRGDLWVGRAESGEVKRLVAGEGRDCFARFTPDGKRVVFCSERSGTRQIYSVNLEGGDLIQHSFHTEGHTLEAISPDGSFALSRGYRAGSGYRPDRLLMTNLNKISREIELFDATGHSGAISAYGDKVLFCRGGEQMYRKGYRGSRASEIHCFDRKSGSFEVIIDEEWEARKPMWKVDGKGFYYVSNREGASNLWVRDLVNGVDQQLTFFQDDGVVFPALSGDGRWMVFVVGKDLYRFSTESGGKAEKLEMFTREDVKVDKVRNLRVSGTNRCAFNGDGSRMVFSAAGDLWMMGSGDTEAVRLTYTDAVDEREPVYSLDGSQIFALVDDGLKCEVKRYGFDVGNQLREEVLPTGGRSKNSLRLSPDGSYLSWLEATGDVVTYRLGESSANVVMRNWDMPTYDWSPDGKWMVVAAKDRQANRDVWLVAADVSIRPRNLTMHPAFEGSPKWSPDGRRIVFTARRGENELAKLWTMDVGEDLVSEEAIRMMVRSVRMIDTEVSEPMRVVWDADSKGVLFQRMDVQDEVIYRMEVDSGKVDKYASFRGVPVGRLGTGLSAWRVNRVPCLFDGSKLREFRFSFSVKQGREDRQRLGFRRIWRTLGERFYDEKMAGVDWSAMLKRLEDEAAKARVPSEFDRVVARLIGELNASHLTFKTKVWGEEAKVVDVKDRTGHTGMIFNDSWDGRLVVKRVVVGAPISKVERPPVEGEIVKRIGGRDVLADTPLHELLNGAIGRVLPIVIEDKDGGERTMELVPVSYNRVRFLERKSREAHAKKMAAEIGAVYLPFRKMSSADLENFSVEVYRASLDAKGMIVDVRDNIGGRVADEMLALFCQPEHSFTVPRGGPKGYPQDRRVSPSWDGPLVVLCNENTYSNAEIFCHAFKRVGRGVLVGMPTNGGVISAVKVTIPEYGELQVPFRGWFHVDTGKDLEMNGAIPDRVVPLRAGDQVSGNDPQLLEALKVLKERME